MALNNRQILLAEAHASGMTALEACRTAGYKPKTSKQACTQIFRMKANEEWAEYVEELQEEAKEAARLDRLDAVDFLCKVITTPIGAFPSD